MAIVAARFNDEIVSQLIAGALRAYRKAGGKPAGVEFVRVPAAAALETGVPIIFGVLTTETFEQAHERADIAKMDKGGESMQAAIEMASLLSRW